MAIKKQILSFNALKIIASFFVVCIHVIFPGRNLIVPIIKTAVPCFFMISGFFLFDNNQETYSTIKIKRQTVKIIKLLLFSNLIYFLWYYCLGVRYDISDIDFWINVLLGAAFGPHLWYLMAYLQVLIMLSFCPKIGNNIIALFIIIVGLLCNLVFGRYAQFFETPVIDNNFFTSALPFILLGGLIKKYQDRVLDCKSKSILIAFIFLLVLSYCEYYSQLFFPEQCFGDINLFIIFLSVLIIIICVKHKYYYSASVDWISKQGSTHSSNIYVYHWFFLYFTTNPLIIFLGSYAASTIHNLLKNRLSSII